MSGFERSVRRTSAHTLLLAVGLAVVLATLITRSVTRPLSRHKAVLKTLKIEPIS